MTNNEKRMYVLVPYNLSDIQKGIQAAHAIAEYAYLYGKGRKMFANMYDDWVENWKTIIVLDAGTTNSNEKSMGTLQYHMNNLKKMHVPFSTFYEPDINNALTAVAFIVDMEKGSHVVGYLKQMGLA